MKAFPHICNHIGLNWRGVVVLFLSHIFLAPSLSAQAYSEKDSVAIKQLLIKGDSFLNNENFDSADYYYNKAGSLAKEVNFRWGYLTFVSYYTVSLNRQGKYFESLSLNLDALHLAESLNDRNLLAITTNNIGNSYIYMGDYKSAASYIMKALQIAEEIGHHQHQQKFNNNLASIFLSLKEIEKALIYATKGYNLAKERNDTLAMASSLVNLAVAEVDNKRTGVAADYLKQVLEIGLAIEDYSYVMDAYINLGDIEKLEKRHLAALKYYHKAQDALMQYPAADYELYIYMGLAECYKNLEVYDEAEHYILKAQEVGLSINSLDELRQIYKLGSELKELMNEPLAALSYRKKYEVLHDSLINQETKNSIHRLEIEYQAAQKEKTLAEQELIIARSNLELQRQSKLTYLIGSVVIALFSIVIIAFIIFRSKQKASAEKIQFIQKQNEIKVLTAMMEGEEKERVRLAKELHDGVGGVLSAAKMHMSVVKNEESNNGSPSKLDQIIALLNYASQEIRAIAHNLSPHILVKYSLDEAISNFCKSVSNAELNIECYILGEFPQFNNSFKLIVYRLVQELINNILKHSEAKNAIVQLSLRDQVLSITVEDDGVGFEMENINGIGLANLQQRVKELNGIIEISSRVGHGTTVYIEFDTASFTKVQNSEVATI